MPTDYSYDQVLRTMQEIVGEVLRKPPEAVEPSARFFLDLGAESLDLLDVRFRIERAFSIRIQQDDINKTISSEMLAKEIKEKLTIDSLVHFTLDRLSVPKE